MTIIRSTIMAVARRVARARMTKSNCTIAHFRTSKTIVITINATDVTVELTICSSRFLIIAEAAKTGTIRRIGKRSPRCTKLVDVQYRRTEYTRIASLSAHRWRRRWRRCNTQHRRRKQIATAKYGACTSTVCRCVATHARFVECRCDAWLICIARAVLNTAVDLHHTTQQIYGFFRWVLETRTSALCKRLTRRRVDCQRTVACARRCWCRRRCLRRVGCWRRRRCRRRRRWWQRGALDEREIRTQRVVITTSTLNIA